MRTRSLLPAWLLRLTLTRGFRTASVEAVVGGWIYKTWHIAVEEDARFVTPSPMGGHSRELDLPVWRQGTGKEVVRCVHFDDCAQIYREHTVIDMPPSPRSWEVSRCCMLSPPL